MRGERGRAFSFSFSSSSSSSSSSFSSSFESSGEKLFINQSSVVLQAVLTPCVTGGVCLNGGSSVPALTTGEHMFCLCADGFEGRRCETGEELNSQTKMHLSFLYLYNTNPLLLLQRKQSPAMRVLACTTEAQSPDQRKDGAVRSGTLTPGRGTCLLTSEEGSTTTAGGLPRLHTYSMSIFSFTSMDLKETEDTVAPVMETVTKEHLVFPLCFT